MARSEFPPAADRIVFGLVPQGDRLETRARLNDLCGALSRESGIPIAPHRAPSPEALAMAMRQERVHFAWVSALLYAQSDVVSKAIPMLSSVRQGSATYHSVLYARADSSMRSVEQLRGAKAAWVSPTSASSYLVPRVSLQRRGIALDRAIREEAFLGSHAAVARAVAERQADIGATYAIFEHGDARRRMVRAGFLEIDDATPMHVLDVAGPIPADLIVAAPSTDPWMRQRIADAFMSVMRDAASARWVRELIGAEGFQPFSADELKPLRELMSPTAGQ